MTNLLVAFATKMGATKGIAEEIAGELHRTFDDVRISDAAAALDVAGMTRPSWVARCTLRAGGPRRSRCSPGCPSEWRRGIPIWLTRAVRADRQA